MSKKFNKKEYDAERQRKLYEDFRKRRDAIEIRLGDECHLCHKKREKGFHLHHIEYHETESNYPRHSKSMNVRFKRLKEAEEHPERFRLLCVSCHNLIHFIEKCKVDNEILIQFLKNFSDK